MKKFKTRKHRNYFKLIIMGVIFVLFLWFFVYISHLSLNKSYKSLINYLLDKEIESNDNSSPINYLMGNLDYLITSYVFEDIKTNNLVYDDFKPLIYIYNTHDSETYNDSSYSIKPSVVTVSLMLKDSLLKYNIDSIVENKSTYKTLGNRKYSESYLVSRNFLEKSVLEYSSLEYFIDIHRDSVSKDYTLVNINNKDYARIMFVLGLDNKNYLKNKVLMEKLNNYLNNNYKGLSRGIYEKQGKGVNGVYNQDFNPNTILIEIGGVDNNLESVFNSTEIIAEALYYIIGDSNEKSS